VADGGDEQLDVAGVEAGGGVAEVDRDACGDARRWGENAVLLGRSGELAGVQGGGRL
jgi:hypothetical protein